MADKCDEHDTAERNRDRHEYRNYQVRNDASAVSRAAEDLPVIKSIGIVTQVRIPVERDADGNNVTPTKREFLAKGSSRRKHPTEGDDTKDDVEVVGIISDKEMGAEEMGAIKRTHWSIENKLHYVLDASFGEDKSTARKCKDNLAVLRKFAYNVARIAVMREFSDMSVSRMLNKFNDSMDVMARYIFGRIKSFY